MIISTSILCFTTICDTVHHSGLLYQLCKMVKLTPRIVPVDKSDCGFELFRWRTGCLYLFHGFKKRGLLHLDLKPFRYCKWLQYLYRFFRRAVKNPVANMPNLSPAPFHLSLHT